MSGDDTDMELGVFEDMDIPEPEYEIETYEGDDEGCEGGACKI